MILRKSPPLKFNEQVTLFPYKQPELVSTLTCIYVVVGHPQQPPLSWKVAIARCLILNRGIVTDTMPATPSEPGWCAVYQGYIVSQVRCTADRHAFI